MKKRGSFFKKSVTDKDFSQISLHKEEGAQSVKKEPQKHSFDIKKILLSIPRFFFSHHLTRAGVKASFFVLRHTLWRFISFTLLLQLYLINVAVLRWFKQINWFSKVVLQHWTVFYTQATKFFNKEQKNTISRVDLIELSIRNMLAKRVRSIVTIGGMAIGIGAIVFLVSLGYGLQELVITRVARLEEMKQTDVSPQPGGKVKIDDKTIADLKDIPKLMQSLPLIAVVGRVSYQSSESDVAVYGVTSDYLRQSAIKPIKGQIFESNDLAVALPPTKREVAGASTGPAVLGDVIQEVEFSIAPSQWIRVRETPSTGGKVIGYTKRVEGQSIGEEVWGGSYITTDGEGNAGKDENNKKLGKWIRSSVLLWQQQTCDPTTLGCEEGKYMILKDTDGMQKQQEGYFAKINVTTLTQMEKKVLGDSTTSTTADSSSLGFIEIASEAGIIAPPEKKTIELSKEAKRQAVVNKAMLQLLGIKEDEAVGKTFTASFIITDGLTTQKERVESTPTEYTIVGVTPDEKTPVFFVPFIDLRSLGITNYSQLKVSVQDKGDLSTVRRKIEAMGYVTRSVADTVAQINSLFNTARTILALLGMVALSVAALGMFNTLTVSLLERTREVGLMKAMGMKSTEVQELFLTESMIIGFFGGVLGIAIGFVLGKLAGLILSFFSLFKGTGFIDISYIPFSFVLLIIFLSLLVGVVTGIFPAKRATKISALNALRYE